MRRSILLLLVALSAVAIAGAADASASSALGAKTGDRAVIVIEGGGSAHAYTTPWAACDDGRSMFIQALVDAGLPVFTAPGYGNAYTSTHDRTGCPPQPPLATQWNTSGYPTQAGEAVLGLLGFLHAMYGYRTFDLVGYSYGGLVARATIAALKDRPAAGVFAPGFSYATAAQRAGVRIPSLITINSPHLGSPTYDIAADPRTFFRLVTSAWGRQFASAGKGLIPFERDGGAGSIHVLETAAHAKADPTGWDESQVGVLDGVKVTLMAGDYCGRSCGDAATPPDASPTGRLRTDGTVPVYSQLLQTCPAACPAPPGSVYLPPGMVPQGVVRKTFPTVHSNYDAKRLGLPAPLSVARNPAAIAFLRDTLLARWRAAKAPLLPRP